MAAIIARDHIALVRDAGYVRPLDLVGKEIGNYVAKSVLGRGGMGVVYMAEHPLIGRKVAVKVLHEELAQDEQMIQRLWIEAKSASEIDSEHIVEMLDFGRVRLGTAAGTPHETVYLAMELLHGRSLADAYWEEGLSQRDAVAIVRQICKGLAASHDKGIVHRDLKPENIFLVDKYGDKNFTKILDFGIAKLISNPAARTRTGVLLGTPAYMSPEQCRGSGGVDHRSDIYSVGIMLYELVAGTLPFAAQGIGDLLVAQMTQRPEPPTTHKPTIPKSLEAIILCALEKRADDRFQSMTALSAALASVVDELDASTVTSAVERSRPDKTTERDRSDDGTLMEPPAADVAPVERGVHAMATQALASDRVHHRETLLKERDDRATELQPVVPELEGTVPVPVVLNQRLEGVSLREALGSTNAVRSLEEALDERGAPRPLAITRDRAVAHEDVFIAGEHTRIRRRVVIISVTVLVTAVLLLLLLR